MIYVVGGSDALRTPQLEDALSSPNLAALSPTTRRRLQALRRGEMPSDPVRTPTDPCKSPFKIQTKINDLTLKLYYSNRINIVYYSIVIE